MKRSLFFESLFQNFEINLMLPLASVSSTDVLASVNYTERKNSRERESVIAHAPERKTECTKRLARLDRVPNIYECMHRRVSEFVAQFEIQTRGKRSI